MKNHLLSHIHAEITSEKMALGHLLDGKVTIVVGTHTHVPTSDAKILQKGSRDFTSVGKIIYK